MKLSTRARYGLRAMVELSAHHGCGTVNMKEISDSQDISRRYLDALFKSLKVAGLVLSYRGVGGGWVLARSPIEISVYDILTALEGSLSMVPCVDFPDTCTRNKTCIARELYGEIHQAMVGVLKKYTLADLCHRQADLNRLSELGPGIEGLCVKDADK